MADELDQDGLTTSETLLGYIAAAEERGRAEGRQWAINTLRARATDAEQKAAAAGIDVEEMIAAVRIAADVLEAMAPGADTVEEGKR
jgi:hypothetical protein